MRKHECRLMRSCNSSGNSRAYSFPVCSFFGSREDDGEVVPCAVIGDEDISVNDSRRKLAPFIGVFVFAGLKDVLLCGVIG